MQKNNKRIKKVKYIIEAFFVYLFLYFFRLLPIEIASKIGGYIFRLLSHTLPVNKVAMKNLAICFPAQSIKEKKETLSKSWDHFGRVFAEIVHWNNISQEEYKKRVKIHYKSKQDLKGALLISAHLGNWELMTRIAKEEGINLCTVYRPANNPYVDNLINNLRKKFGALLIKKGMSGIRSVIKNLKENRTVGMLVDQKTNDGINVPFFELKAKTTPSPAAIALKYKIPIIPVSFIRVKGLNYYVEFDNPIPIKAEDTPYTIMSKINKIFENWIIKHPEQWFWFHNRWPK